MKTIYTKSLEEAIEELDVIDKKVEYLIDLDKRLRGKSDISVEDAIEIDGAIPGGKTLNDKFGLTPATEQYKNALEEIDLALVGAIVAGAAILVYALHRMYKYFSTGTSKGGGSGGGSKDELPSKEQIESVAHEHLENDDKWNKVILPIIDKVSDLGLPDAITDYAKSSPSSLTKFADRLSGLSICTHLFAESKKTAGDVVLEGDLKSLSEKLGLINKQLIKDITEFYRSHPDDDSQPVAERYKSLVEAAKRALEELYQEASDLNEAAKKSLDGGRNYSIPISAIQNFRNLVRVSDSSSDHLSINKKIMLMSSVISNLVDNAQRDKDIEEIRSSVSIAKDSLLDKATRSGSGSPKEVTNAFTKCEKAIMSLTQYLQRDNLQFISYKIHFVSYIISTIKEMQIEFKRGNEHGPHFHRVMMELNNESVKNLIEGLSQAREELVKFMPKAKEEKE